MSRAMESGVTTTSAATFFNTTMCIIHTTSYGVTISHATNIDVTKGASSWNFILGEVIFKILD
jgi:hypothetical protein